MRNACQVIEQMLAKIPVDKLEFIADLNWNHTDASYKAPEETIQWIRTQQTLMKHIESPKEEWEFEVLSIFSTIPVNEIKKQVLGVEDNIEVPPVRVRYSDEFIDNIYDGTVIDSDEEYYWVISDEGVQEPLKWLKKYCEILR